MGLIRGRERLVSRGRSPGYSRRPESGGAPEEGDGGRGTPAMVAPSGERPRQTRKKVSLEFRSSPDPAEAVRLCPTGLSPNENVVVSLTMLTFPS